jgi:hypothetical protein
VALIAAQLGGLSSLREVQTVWNAQASHHYHLASGSIRRSTLSDANRRRPRAIFADAFAIVSELAGCALPRGGAEVLRLTDATPIPLPSLHKWAAWNGRTHGMMAHLVYDPDGDRPVYLEITAATVNDVVAGRRQPIEAGATYVFDKAYADYAWWNRLHEAGCRFVTRPKSNVPLRLLSERAVSAQDRQEAAIESDGVVELASQQRARLPIALRRANRRPLPSALANRAVVPLDQAAPQNPHLPRPLRECCSPPDLCRHDRLPAAAHRRPRQPIGLARLALRRFGADPAVRTHPASRSRKTTAPPQTPLQ